MFGKTLRAAVVPALLMLPSAVPAVGLGDIRLNSSLNAPLSAEIELIGATPEELASLDVELASRETFSRYGLERPAFLNSLELKPARSGSRDVIQVRSKEAMTEPFVTLLIEVNWARGRLVREYTVLLDPPVYTPVQSPPAAVATPAAGAGERSGAIERAPERQPAQAPAAADAAAAPTSASPSAAQTRLVRPGESLSAIARQLGGDPPARLMVGLYRANPDAFEGDMNSLRAGAILRLPSAEELAGIGTAEATSEVRRHYTAWRQRTGASGARSATDEGQLRLVTPSELVAAANGAEIRGLRERVRALEGELAESRRLIELRNAELAELQAKLAAARQSPTAQPTAPATAAATVAEVAPPVTTAEAPDAAPEAAPDAQEPTAPAEPAAVAQAPAASEPAAQPPRRPGAAESGDQAQGSSLLETLGSLWFVPVLLLALIGGWFGYRKFRERQQVEFDDRLGELAATSEPAPEDVVVADVTNDTARLRQPVMREEDGFLVEESGTHERPAIDESAMGRPRSTGNVAADETLSSEAAISLDQGDPLAEADFHMAYGLYDQAADLVRIASEREPQRRDLKLKLLEVFFVWGNREQFLHTARELAETRAEAAPGEWEKIVIMGRQLAPEDPLFVQDGGVSGAAAAGIDLNLEGGQNRVDFDLFGEPAPAQSAGGAGVDLEFAAELAELGDQDPTGEAQGIEVPTVADAEVDFMLDDPGRGADGSGNTTRQMTSRLQPEPTVSLAEFASDAEASEAPTVEQPALRVGENATLREKLEGVQRLRAAAGEQTEELALDDLGLDLSALEDTGTSPAAADAPTLVAGLDERSRQIMADAESRAEPPSGAPPSESGTWLIDENDLEASLRLPKVAEDGGLTESLRSLDVEGERVSDGSETASLAVLKEAEDVDLDLGSLDATHPSGANGATLDLDVGLPAAPADGLFEATQRVNPGELALPDLEPVTMSEVGTKLDLARAYMDMGDPEGARSILEEVLQEGSQSQKQEAQRLVASLPG